MPSPTPPSPPPPLLPHLPFLVRPHFQAYNVTIHTPGQTKTGETNVSTFNSVKIVYWKRIKFSEARNRRSDNQLTLFITSIVMKSKACGIIAKSLFIIPLTLKYTTPKNQ